MEGGGKFSLMPGQWTDDTSMALCMAESLIECQGFNLKDQASRYWKWYQEGHLSSTGECFDIGMTTRKALHAFDKLGHTNPYCGATSESAAGNGSLMRLCPVALAYHNHPVWAMELSGESSRVTHGTQSALDACMYFGGLLVGCIKGCSKDELLSPCYAPAELYWDHNRLAPDVKEVACGSFKHRSPPDIKASGHVVRSLEAALWAFYHTSDFKEGCLCVVNLGDDSDTVGAIYGQLAGAYYGAHSIPEEWKADCSFWSLIELFAEELFHLSGYINLPDPSVENNPLTCCDKLSNRYYECKIKGYTLLEEGNKEIIRRVRPCPKQYKSLEAFDEAVQSLKDAYHSLPTTAQDENILNSFEKIWMNGRKSLIQKFSRTT